MYFRVGAPSQCRHVCKCALYGVHKAFSIDGAHVGTALCAAGDVNCTRAFACKVNKCVTLDSVQLVIRRLVERNQCIAKVPSWAAADAYLSVPCKGHTHPLINKSLDCREDAETI